MELKDYQQTVLDTLDAYLDELGKQKKGADEVAKFARSKPELKIAIPDFPLDAWNALKAAGRLPASRAKFDYSKRMDAVGRNVPNVCLKIPTGGGKTLLAANGVAKILSRYLNTNTGFVLWIVPNEAIYTQTKKQLANREHPYRQILDRAAAGKVKFMEKEDRLDVRDVETHLCVMLLMLQSANRETKETLRLFRDRGNVHGFFPTEDNYAAHAQMLSEISNLDSYGDPRNLGSIIKDSLGNALRKIQPVVVMDEGHKAFSTKALETLYGFNPCFVMELSTTPKDRLNDTPPRHANWLVDVRGKALADEDMIKLPINLKVKPGNDWRDTLRESLEKLDQLQAEAERLQARDNRYIRPVLLIQVERTGKDQRDGGHIHAEDVREFLLQAGMAEQEIAVKSAEVDELAALDSSLLSPANTVRAIITKQALQEGWDCPFAYVLCSLAASHNMGALTQLIGRILRQPHAQKTGVAALDECYVFCQHEATKDVVKAIKDGLEKDGMADLALEVRDTGNNGKSPATRQIPRRAKLEKLEIFLPVVNRVDGESVRALDYEQDILQALDWAGLDVARLGDKLSPEAHAPMSQMTRLTVADGEDFLQSTPTVEIKETASFDPAYATRMIADIVPNPWMGRALIGRLIGALQARGFGESDLGNLASFIIEELRKFLLLQRDALAETHFAGEVKAGRIQFRLRADAHNWKMPKTTPTQRLENAPRLRQKNDNALEKSLFAPVYQDDFNQDEQDFACYLDEDKALHWWHRNVAKNQYYVQGWRKNKVYPDFIFAWQKTPGHNRLMVLETKGDQLAENLDTAYKTKLLKLMSESFGHETPQKAGELELVVDENTIVQCDLVLMSDLKTRFHQSLESL